MLETFERGKKYEVVKKWSAGNPAGLARMRDSLEIGEVLRFRGPNFTGAEFLDETGKLVILPVKVAFKIMGNLTSLALDSRCECDLQDSPDAPADWHGKDCPRYRASQ